MKTWLLLDVHYLAYRAFHTTGTLSYGDKPTGVLFGFLKSLPFLKDDFQTDRIAFCFEHPNNYRKDIFPAYKAKRHARDLSAEELKVLREFRHQIDCLRRQYLPMIGFLNVFQVDGYESDDLLAVLASEISLRNEEAIIVTGDNDLLQCITERVSVYSPNERKIKDLNWFKAEYGFHPRKWAMVKAIAGCHTDEVPGIPRIGEKTAIKFLKGELKEESAAYKAITSRENRAIIRRNRPLVELPMVGCPSLDLYEDNVSRAGWIKTCDALGFSSIIDRPPVATRKLMSYGKSQRH